MSEELNSELVREIAVLTTMLRKREEQVNAYANSALRVAEANADLSARAARAELELERVRAELSATSKKLGKATARVKAMEGSRSWRWTRFLRRGK